MALQGFLHNLDNAINLRDTKNTDVLQAFEVSVTLRDAAGYNDWLASVSRLLDQVDELFLARVLNCARV
jgi:hypothetical protein